MTKPWKTQALNVMQNHLNELEQDLPPGSSINDIEKKLWNSQRAHFQEILQTRVNSEFLSWPNTSTRLDPNHAPIGRDRSRAWAAPPAKIENCVRDGRRTMPVFRRVGG